MTAPAIIASKRLTALQSLQASVQILAQKFNIEFDDTVFNTRRINDNVVANQLLLCSEILETVVKELEVKSKKG